MLIFYVQLVCYSVIDYKFFIFTNFKRLNKKLHLTLFCWDNNSVSFFVYFYYTDVNFLFIFPILELQ